MQRPTIVLENVEVGSKLTREPDYEPTPYGLAQNDRDCKPDKIWQNLRMHGEWMDMLNRNAALLSRNLNPPQIIAGGGDSLVTNAEFIVIPDQLTIWSEDDGDQRRRVPRGVSVRRRPAAATTKDNKLVFDARCVQRRKQRAMK